MTLGHEQMRSLGILSIRLLLGIIFFAQGYGKLMNYGLENLYDMFTPYGALYPNWVLKLTMYFTTFGELIFGFLLVIGLLRKVSYIGLMSILLIVSFGHGMKNPIWELDHVMFRAILLIPLFLLPMSWDKIALDNLKIFKKKVK